MREFKQSVALVTGGGHGIGRATAILLAREGARVHICGRTLEALEETRRQTEQEEGCVIVHQADVTAEDAVDEMMARIAETDEYLDILVNNAGMLGPRTKLEEVSLEDWTTTLTVNCTGVFLITRRAISLLRNSDTAVVINLSSSVGRRGRGEWGPYSVSKHGVEGLTDVYGDELEDDAVCVVSINPGGTATKMRAEAYPEEDPQTLPEPEDVARTIVLLAQRLDVGQTRRKYSSRALFDFVIDRRVGGADLPHDRSGD
ncbi:MAG: SDR family NAD(P)-dependent oxidoreductase [Bradymonadaceae bacterium]